MQANTRQYLLIFQIFWLAISCSQGNAAEPSFVRFIPGALAWEGELQTAVVSYENADGVVVDLVSAIHLGEEEYYAALNKYFLDRDAVLYELVAHEDVRPNPESVTQSISLVSFVQRALGNFLDVKFQLEQIDYSPQNFIHADLNPDELRQIMLEKDESFLSMFIALAIAQLADEQAASQQGEQVSSFNAIAIVNALLAEDQTAAFKYLFAEELGRTDGIIVAPELESQITILGDRNNAALKVLEETLSDTDIRTISIFYGAAHMPRFERELLERFGFKQIQKRWLNAWIMP